MKKAYRESLKKVFVSLFIFFYTFLPYGFAIADIVNEFQEDNVAPMEMEVVEEEMVEEVLPEEEIKEGEAIVNPEGEKLLKDTMSYPVWDVHGDTAITYENVELGKLYTAPQDSRVRIIFTKLPEVSSKLTIEKIILTQEEIDITGAISDVAYDITTDMENGTFEYDLELPSTEDNVKIVYVEEREDIFTNLIPLENEIIKKEDTVKIRKVDHFTILIVTGVFPTTSDDSIVVGIGGSVINWPESGNQSGLGFVGGTDLNLEELASTGIPFILGDFTHYNNPVSDAIDWADLKINLTEQVSSITLKEFSFRVKIEETDNKWPCNTGFQISNTACDDRITFPQSIDNQTITVAGIQYTLVIDGFRRTINGETLGHFITEEYKTNTAFLVGRFVPVGRITVKKLTNPNDDTTTSFDFKTTGTNYTKEFSLKNGEENTQVLPAGRTYSVSEELPTDWNQESVSCVNSEGVSKPNPEAPEALVLDSGEIITCTFTNTQKQSSIEITKVVDWNGVAVDEAETFEICITGPSYSTADCKTITYEGGKLTWSGLIPGEYTVTEPNLGNSWTMSATSPVTVPANGGTGTATITNTHTQTPKIEVTKSSKTILVTESGQIIPYIFTVKNVGNITLTGITVTDPRCTPIYESGDSNNDTALQLDEIWVYKCNYTVTQGDIDAGDKLSNTVTADSAESDPDTDTKEIPITQTKALSIVKTANPTTYNKVGDVISYSYLVTNTGNVTLTGPFTVSDDKTTNTSCPPTESLAPNGSITCAATYTITQADLDNKSVTNKATASNGTVTSNEDTATVTSVAGRIIIEKQTLPDGSTQSFEFNPSWSESNFNLTDGVQNDSGWLALGTYSISEIVPSGWQLTNIECDSENTSSTVGYKTNSATITLGASDIVTCVFTNSQKGTITVIKDDNIDSGQDFVFNAWQGMRAFSFTLSDDGINNGKNSRTFTGLVSIPYNIKEEVPTGWSASIVSCTSDNPMPNSNNTLGYGEMSISLRPGENIICTFTNTRDTGSIKVNKYTDINGDGDWKDSNETKNSYANGLGFRWSIDDGSDNEMGNTVSGIYTGTHSITESMPDGYHFVSWYYTRDKSKSCTKPNGTELPVSLDVTKGKITEITICNARDTGKITIIKDAINDSHQSFYFKTNFSGGFFLKDDGNKKTKTEQKTFTLPTGTYWVDEQEHSDWKLTDLSCAGNDNSVIDLSTGRVDINLGAGDEVVCTYTNTQLAKIWGYKYNDKNGDGNWNLGEPGLGNWKISLVGNASTTTSNFFLSRGYYEFDNLLPGTYKVCEEKKETWSNTTALCKTITLNPGDSKNINFSNIQYGKITVHKYYDMNGNGELDKGEKALKGWEMNVYEGYGCKGEPMKSISTKMNGNAVFRNIVSGKYSVKETLRDGWSTTTPECTNIFIEPTENGKINIGNVQLTDIYGIKWSDFNGNGRRDCMEDREKISAFTYKNQLCELEPLLPNWTINLYKWNGKKRGYDSEPQTTQTDENGEYAFEKLLPGKYKVCEVNQEGWTQTFPSSKDGCYEITLPLKWGNRIERNFGNTINPILNIRKSNNSNKEGILPGDTVTYTITITTPSDEKEGTYVLKDIIVTDLLPEGFTYIPGSWTGTTAEPVYSNNLAKWYLGDIQEGDTVVLTYKALISPTQEPGIYPDIAWTKGTSLSDNEVLGNVSTGALSPFVGTEVLVIGEYDIEEGEVLGISTTTTLPSTGASKYITIGALISMLLGLLSLIFKPSTSKRKSLLVVSILTIGIFALVKPNIAYAEGGLSTDIDIRIEQPETKTNKNTFNLGYVVLDTKEREIEVKCIEETYGTFDTHSTNSGNCKIDSSVVTESGTYKFYVEVSTVSGAVELEKSKTVTVNIDLSKPQAVKEYSKTEEACSYTLSFKSSTPKVQIFRSDNQVSFFANASTLITKPHLTVIPNSTSTYIDNDLPDCTKTYYYAIRSIDDYNNVSPLITDDIVTTVTAISPTTTTTTSTPTTLTSITTDAGEVEGEITVDKDSTVEKEEEVKGEEDKKEEEVKEEQEEEKTFIKRYWPLLAILLIVIGGVGYGYVRRKK